MLILDEYYIHIMTLKSTFKKTNKITSISLQDVNIIDDNKKKQFQIITNNKKITIKAENEKDKFLFMDKVNLAKKNLIMHRASTISSNIDNDDTSEKVIIKIDKLKSFLNKLDEINENILQIQMLEGEIKNKTREKFRSFVTNIIYIGDNLKKKIDKIISNNQYHIIQNKNNLNLINENKIEINTIKENNESVSSSDEIEENYDMERLEEIKSIKEILNSSNMKISKFKKGLSTTITDFSDSKYNFSRNSLPINLQCPETMVKDFVKTFTLKNTSLPILYNEPISMLQKQCEKFYYSNLLKEASNEKINKELKICYLIGFICGELSLNINRYLKPFNPILGETFEFYDNNKKYRYFSEQVSHNPPITAYIGESNNFCYFGDTRFKNSFKIFKGAMEIKFTNKTHVIFKNTQDKYVFNKPVVYLIELMSGTPKYDYDGKIVIEDVNNKDIKGEINFYEGKSKSINEVNVEGSVFKNGNVVYKIKGNWNNNLYFYTKKNESDKNIFWKIFDDPSLNNSLEKYVLPSYSLNFNLLTDNLKKILPKTDSRLRPDQREYENGNVDEATKLRKIIEDKQRARHKKFDEQKIIYEPLYFNNLYSSESSDFVYIYKGNYFEDRNKGIINNKVFDIFSTN
jgi:hypothetical protein